MVSGQYLSLNCVPAHPKQPPMLPGPVTPSHRSVSAAPSRLSQSCTLLREAFLHAFLSVPCRPRPFPGRLGCGLSSIMFSPEEGSRKAPPSGIWSSQHRQPHQESHFLACGLEHVPRPLPSQCPCAQGQFVFREPPCLDLPSLLLVAPCTLSSCKNVPPASKVNNSSTPLLTTPSPPPGSCRM